VYEAVAGLLSRGYPTLGQTARAVGCSPRTLQRRLHDAGITYSELVDRVRAEAACRLLDDPTLHLYEIASALGFADPGSFSRFFRRTRGVSPREARPRRCRDQATNL
jgi:AraC-like DNA-binding protein